MRLRPPEDRDFDLLAAWLAEPENHRWLWFGPGVQSISAAVLKMMSRRDHHLLRVVSTAPEAPPAGLVALSDVDRAFGMATLWYVLGDRAQRGRGLAARAVRALLTEAFGSGLRAVQAWAVDGNVPSIRVLQRNGFRFVGRQRMCHVIDGVPRDRLLYDLVATEHREATFELIAAEHREAM